MRHHIATLPLLFASLLAPVAAHASTLDVFTINETTTLVGPTTNTTFSLPTVLDPTKIVHFSVDEFDTTGTSYVNGQPTADLFQFYDTTGGGGMCDNLTCSNMGALPALFTGNVNAPTLLATGNYTFQDVFNNTYSLAITQVATPTTPEPGSLVLLGTGLLGVVGVARRRFSRS